MDLNSKQANFTIPVICKDQATDICTIEAAANKALQNIYSLYDEIMTPKSNFDWEISMNGYSSDSTSVPIIDKNGFHFDNDVPKLQYNELCSKCQKLVSLCSVCQIHNSRSILQNQYHPQIINNKFFQECTNSSPLLKPFCRNSFCHPKQKKSHHQQHAQKISQEQTEINQQEKCVQKIPQQDWNNSIKFQQERRVSYPDSEYNDYSSIIFKQLKESNMQCRITVPKPFSLTSENAKRQLAKEEKISKLKAEIDSQIEKELKVKFFSKPVPKHVYLPLYEKMLKMNEKRKKERKESIEIINEKLKPFNLSANAQTCISKSSSDFLQNESKIFKARPVPKNILSKNLTQNFKKKEEMRKLLIAKRAEEMLKTSSLPFSPKPVHHSLSLFNISDTPNKNVTVAKEKIENITNRLYNIKCQEAIENWKEKVLQNDFWNSNCHEKSNCDKKKYESAFSFHNFPVRKTTTTFLREKQIREDIKRKQDSEGANEILKEEISQKRKEILKNMWPRLKSAEQIYDIQKEIEEKVKSYRNSQKIREQEYKRELEDIMRKVSKQFLLIERQSKDSKRKIVVTNEEVSSDKDKIDSLENDESSISSTSVKSDLSTPSASENSDSV